jgi:hypothetical protein
MGAIPCPGRLHHGRQTGRRDHPRRPRQSVDHNPPAEDVPLVVEQLRDDGIEVARYVARRFGKHKVILMGGSWGSVHATPKAEADYTAGEDYSWLQFVGLKGDGIASKIDLVKLGLDFIQAPRKEFVLVPRTGHDPNPPMIAAQYKLLKERIGDCR